MALMVGLSANLAKNILARRIGRLIFITAIQKRLFKIENVVRINPFAIFAPPATIVCCNARLRSVAGQAAWGFMKMRIA